jgi:hypothetical protein
MTDAETLLACTKTGSHGNICDVHEGWMNPLDTRCTRWIRAAEAELAQRLSAPAQCDGYAGDPGASAPRCESYMGHPGNHFIDQRLSAPPVDTATERDAIAEDEQAATEEYMADEPRLPVEHQAETGSPSDFLKRGTE